MSDRLRTLARDAAFVRKAASVAAIYNQAGLAHALRAFAIKLDILADEWREVSREG